MTNWLFTFLVHSTLWLGLAWLGLRLVPRTPARLRESIWQMALAASLITPTVHALTSTEATVWQLPGPSFIAGGEHHPAAEPGHDGGQASVPGTPGEHASRAGAAGSLVSPVSVGILWLTLAAGPFALYLVRLNGLRRRLRDREPVTYPRAARTLAALAGRAAVNPPPRLTESHGLGSPVALGVGSRREICLPVRALHELDHGELRALLAHEVAHHLRRDTLRLAVLNVLQAVFCFQPLVRLAVREIRLAAEELCDDWAARQTKDSLAMASCLAEVARWVVPGDRTTPVPCIGRRRSRLERRVRRLMDERPSPRTPSRSWRRVSAAGLLVLSPLFAPAVAPAGDGSSGDEEHVFERGRTREHEPRMRGTDGESQTNRRRAPRGP